MRFRLTVTVSEHGTLPENGERLLEGFVRTHPEVGPVVSQDTETGTLSATISFEAEDIHAAIEKGVEIFVQGINASGLPPTDVLDITAAAATAEEYDREPEMQPA